MSLTSVITTASAALQTTQYQIAVTSGNIANASTAGATQKTYTSTSSATLTSALSTGELTRITDAYLSKTVNTSSSADGASSVTNTYLSSYDDDLGSVANGDDVSSVLTSFQTALSTLAASPSSTSDKAAAVSAATTLANNISGLSTTIQTLRTQASTDIGTTVASINTDLASIASLNSQIAAGQNSGADITGLEDQRDTTLTDLASQVGVSYFTDSNNQLVVYDQGGDQLVSGSTAATLSYTGNGQLSADTTYPGTISGITLNGKDVTSSLTSGTLGGLVTLRDTTLPDQQDQLDQLASSLITTTNAAANAGTAYPPPSTLTSDSTVSAGDSFSASGTVRIAVTSSTGTVVSSTDLDLSSYSTVSDLLSGLNSISGITASISSAGKLVIQTTDSSTGVAINGLTSSVGSSDQGFSDYFGFNDVFTGEDASDIAVSSTLAANTATLATATLSDSTTLAAGDAGVSTSDASAITALTTALSATRTLSADGSAVAQTTSIAGAASTFVSSAASLISDASTAATDNDAAFTTASNTLSNTVGISVDAQTALLTQYQNQYEATAQLMTAAKAMFTTLITMMNA
jgi:flagellar hook-associated protein 1 FlgK